MNFISFLPYLLKMFALAPIVIQGIQQLHAEKDSTTKRQLAHDALQLASGVAAVVDPADSQTIGGLSDATHAIIDSVGGLGASVSAVAGPSPVALSLAASVAAVDAASTQKGTPVQEVTPSGKVNTVWK